MTIAHRRNPRLLAALAALLSVLVIAPSSASAWWHTSGWQHTYGATSLQLDPGTAAALKGLKVEPGVVAPATVGSEGSIGFPITNSFGNALFTRTIKHSGGITLSKGATVVSLTDYWIALGSRTLSANVSVAGGPNLGRVPILNLDFSKARVHFWPGVSIGPIRATLTEAAASTLNSVFGTNALSDETVLGEVTVQYNGFGF